MKAGGQIALGKQIFTGPGAHLILSSPNGLNDFLSTPESRSLQQAYLPPLLTGLGNGIQQKGIQDSDSIVSLIASANQALVQGNEGEARRCLKELAEKLSQINPSSYMEAVATSGARRFATHKDFMDMLGKALSGKESKQDPTLDEERRLCIPPAWMLEDTAVVNKGGHGGFVYGDVSMEGALTMGMTTPLGVMASISKTSQNGPAPKTIILDGHTYTQADIDKKVNDLRKADWKVTDPALDFFRNHLPLLIERGLFTRDHYERIVANLNHPVLDVRSFALYFFTNHLPLLIEKGLFTRDHYKRIVATLSHPDLKIRASALGFFRENISLLIEKGLFTRGHCKLIIANLSHPEPESIDAHDFFRDHLALLIEKGLFTRDHYKRIVATLSHPDLKIRASALYFFTNHLPLLIEKGLFTRGHCKLIIANLSHPEPEVSIDAHDFFRDYLALLIEKGLFTRDHYKRIVATLSHPDLKIRASALYFFTNHLPLLIEKGLFTRDHCKLIIANLSYPMVRVNDAALEFFSDHLPLLIERDYTSQKEIAVIAFQDPDVLQKFFYLLKGHGFINRDLLVAILQQASDSKNILGILANSPDWLSSPHRWNQLLTLLRYEEKRNILRILLGKLRVFAISPNAEEMTGFVSMMNMMTPKELRLLSQEGGSSWITRAQKMRQVLEDSANHFEASQDPRYLAIQKRLEEEGGKILLLDWSLVGMNQVWKSYRLDSDFKKKRKQFLNFLEQNIKRPFPSLARIYTKRGEQVIEEQFTKRLGEEFKAIYARPAWQRLKTSPLYWLLIKASRFMNPEGIASMRRLIEGLRVENGQLVFPRYEELKGVVSDSFLAEWQKEFAVEPQQLGSLEEEAGKEALKAQVTAQVKGHLQMKEGVNREDVSRAIRDLPERVQRWRDAFEASSELDGTFSNEAKALQDIFEAHYNDIRKHFGDTFANIRIDLRNYRQGMERGVRQARRSERFVVSGDIRQIAKSGSEPVETCQTLEYAWANQEGQPLHRMMHGQFKVTNWEIDGVVYARRLLEVTVDERGKEHLLVERLYTAGGFGRIKEFKEQILEYAKNLGIEESHIHFSDEESAQSAPKPLRTGDLIYRDTFREEGQTLQEAAAVRANNRR